MTADDASRVVTFTGRVVARQGNLVISCDAMRVYYLPQAAAPTPVAPPVADPAPAAGGEPAAPSPASEASAPAPGDDAPDKSRSPLSGGQEIDRVECEGGVKIHQGERLGVGEKALYLAKSLPRRLILTGEARVWQGPNSVTGHQITYYLDENRSVVDSQRGQRVQAFYDQGGDGN
jgi:lipopolysaccharide export system protein LptA